MLFKKLCLSLTLCLAPSIFASELALKIDHIQQDADMGNVESQYKMAVLYHRGAGLDQDYAKAFKYYQMAAARGHGMAQFHLGLLYDKGEGLPRSGEKALFWYLKAIDNKVAKAMFNLGTMYYYARSGIGRDYVKAFNYVEQAAELGVQDAQYLLARMFLKAHGTEHSLSSAHHYYYEAAKQGHMEAQYELGRFYRQKHTFIFKDLKETFYWHQKAALQGHAKAQASIARMYANGIEVDKNIDKAIHYHSLACAQGLVDACNSLNVVKAENYIN